MKQIFYSVLAAVVMFAGANSNLAQQKADFLKTSAEIDETENKKKSVKFDETENKDKKDNSNEEKAEESAAKTKAQAASSCESCRWFEPTAATFSMRYRTITNADNIRTFNQGQQRTILAGKFKFDKEGKYTVNVHASSGYYFNWAFSDTGLGNNANDARREGARGQAVIIARDTAPPAIQAAVAGFIRTNYPTATPAQIAQLTPALTERFTPIVTNQVIAGTETAIRNINTRVQGFNIFVRQLYFQAKPIDGLEFQYGSLPINKGVNSESTSYDDDGYVMGGRISVKKPKKFFFDEMSVTYAYLGEIFTPNFFRRTDRFKESNYHQFLVRKKLFNGRVDASTDYTFQNGTDTMREGVTVKTKELKVVDNIRVEAYQRIGSNLVNNKTFKGGSGFYVSADKTFGKRLTLNGGVASIDRHYTVYGEYNVPSLDLFGFALNGDQTGVGKRFIGRANFKATKDLSFSTMYSQTFNNKTEDMRFYWNKSHFNVAVTYDLLEGAKRLGWFR